MVKPKFKIKLECFQFTNKNKTNKQENLHSKEILKQIK